MKMRHKTVPAKYIGFDCHICLDCARPTGHPGGCTCSCRGARTYWYAPDLTRVPKDEPFACSLIKYRIREDRIQLPESEHANLISSRTRANLHAPIIDLDYAHAYVPSATGGHGHLYLNVPISRWRWWVLMFGLRVGKVIEKGTFAWSLRRGGNYVRKPGVGKTEVEPQERLKYGWVLPKKKSD